MTRSKRSSSPALAVHGMQQRVLELDVGAGHAMEQHVQLADGPRRGIVHLAAEAQVGGIAAGLLDELAADDEHAAGAAGGVIDAQARRGLEDADHQADDVARGVEVAALLARRLGEHVDQELVGRAEQVGELEVLIAQAVAVEVADEVLARVIGDDALVALHAHEADVVEDVFERFVVLAQRAEGLVEHAAERLGGVVELALEIGPAGAFGDEEAVVEIGVLAVLRFRRLLDHPLLDLAADDFLALGVEDVRAALQEQHPEDVVLVGGRIQAFLAEPVGGRIEVAFELGEREFSHALSQRVAGISFSCFSVFHPCS